MTHAIPGKSIVWPVTRKQVKVSWDADSAFSGTIAWAPAQTIHLTYEPLATISVSQDADGIRYPNATTIRPRLATHWEHSPDFRTWVIHLRQGVTSHAGNELTADDVKWSWDRAFALRGLGVWRSRRVAGVSGPWAVEPISRYAVRFTLTGPNPEFPQFLIFSTNMVIDSVEAQRHASPNDPWATQWLGQHVAGWGAFDLRSHTPDAISVEARASYWSGRPGIERVTQVAVDRREQALKMLERGEANLILNLYPDELARLERLNEVRTYLVRGSHSSLDLDWHHPPFDDQRVRQAVALALPYQRIFDDVYRGFARPCRSLLEPSTTYYSDAHWQYNTDLDRARDVLRAAGYGSGFATDLWITPSAEALRFAEVVREALADVAIAVDVRVGHPPGHGPKMHFRDECGHALPEAMYDLAHDFDPPLGMRAGFDERDKVWSERLQAIRSAEAPDQRGMYDEIQRDLLEFCGIIPIAEIQTGWAVREPLDPWALSENCLSVQTTVWGGHRWDLGIW